MLIPNINALRDSIHQANVARGWWTGPDGESTRGKRDIPEALCLIHSEVSEGMEAARKGLMDDKITWRKGLDVELADAAIRTLDLAGGYDLDMDCDGKYAAGFQRLLDMAPASGGSIGSELCMLHWTISSQFELFTEHGEAALWLILAHISAIAAALDIDLIGAIEDKLEFNAVRPDHDPVNRAAPGGKSF